MTRRTLLRVLAGWAGAVALAGIVMHSCTRIDLAPMPDRAARRWVLDALEAGRMGQEIPEAPASAASYVADGPIVVHAWWRGRSMGRHVGGPRLERTVRDAIRALGADQSLTGLPGWRTPRGERGAMELTADVSRGETFVLTSFPFLDALQLVPLHDGLVARLDDRVAVLTPDDLRAMNAYDAHPTPLPELSFGVDLPRLVDQLARELGGELEDLEDRGELSRARFGRIARSTHPRRVQVNAETLRQAALDGAEFTLRHQRPDGMYTYIYDARSGRSRPEPYNLPRHAGTTYYLAQVHHLAGMPEAREGAVRGLRWALRHHLRRCGGEDIPTGGSRRAARRSWPSLPPRSSRPATTRMRAVPSRT
jgi:hypothetical protein